MRSMSLSSSLPLAAGLAIALSFQAIADPAVAPTRAGKLTDLRVERASTDASSPRDNGFGGAFVTMRDALENFPVNTNLGGMGVSAPAASFTGPPGFVWPLNNLRGQADGETSGNIWARVVDLSTAPVGGPNGVVNATKVLRIQTAAAQTPGGFFTGANLRFGGAQPDEPTLTLAPTADNNARVDADYFVSTIDQTFTFESVAAAVGFVTGRLLWGGVYCDSPSDPGCTDNGLPSGLISTIHALAPCDTCGFGVLARFTPARYCIDGASFEAESPIPGCVPPPGFAVGDPVAPPIGNWARFAFETRADGRVRFLLDRFDGAGEAVIYQNRLLISALIDRVASNTSFESQDAFVLIDNIEASGHIFPIPKAPPLDCPYLDDMEWLNVGPLLSQSPRWDAALTSGAVVNNDGNQGQVIRQTNSVDPNNQYRREIATQLPPSAATLGNDLIATVKVRTSGGTVRGFALFNGESLAARVFLGRDDPNDPDEFFYEPGIYAQINPSYDPIDLDEIDPYDNISVVGVDVADTNVEWINNFPAYRALEFRLSANGALRVSIDGQRIYAGAGAFSSGVDTFAFESENQAFGSNSLLRIDDVTLACDAPPCAADFNLDDTVDFADLNAALASFGASGLPAGALNAGDANADGVVNFADLNAVLAAFGTACD